MKENDIALLLKIWKKPDEAQKLEIFQQAILGKKCTARDKDMMKI